MNKAQRPCKKLGCTSLTRSTYCESHSDEQRKVERRYDKAARNPEHVRFYNSKEWQDARKQAIIRDHGMCVKCLRDGRYRKVDVVDHIVELQDDWTLRITLSNLQCLCHGCHNQKTNNERQKRRGISSIDS